MRTSHDHRVTRALISGILDVLDKHGYHSAGHQYTGRAIVLAGDLARSCEDPKDAHAGSRLQSQPPGASTALAGHADNSEEVAISRADAGTVLAALDEAADVQRDRANCADCVAQSCGTCQYRPRSARPHDSAAACLLAAAQPSRPASPDQRPAPDGLPHIDRQDQARPDSEAWR